jgi:CheY-like chemotaxis protein
MRTRPSPPTVLLIDDDVAIRTLFATALDLAGYTPVEAATAEAGLHLIEAGLTPDAVLLDIEMPGMGGMGFLLQLRADPRRRRIPIAIVTGCVPVELVRQTADVFNVGVYPKPLLPEQLLEITEQLVAGNVH